MQPKTSQLLSSAARGQATDHRRGAEKCAEAQLTWSRGSSAPGLTLVLKQISKSGHFDVAPARCGPHLPTPPPSPLTYYPIGRYTKWYWLRLFCCVIGSSQRSLPHHRGTVTWVQSFRAYRLGQGTRALTSTLRPLRVGTDVMELPEPPALGEPSPLQPACTVVLEFLF